QNRVAASPPTSAPTPPLATRVQPSGRARRVAEFRERPEAELHYFQHPPMTSPLRLQFWEVPISVTKSELSPRRHAVPCVACWRQRQRRQDRSAVARRRRS